MVVSGSPQKQIINNYAKDLQEKVGVQTMHSFSRLPDYHISVGSASWKQEIMNSVRLMISGFLTVFIMGAMPMSWMWTLTSAAFLRELNVIFAAKTVDHKIMNE